MTSASISPSSTAAGTTSRTLRHYDDIQLLTPTRIGRNGYRYYDEDSLVRLQRILLLRELGLGLPTIAEILAGQRGNADALHTHLDWLRKERTRLERRIAAVENTIKKIEGGEPLVAEEMFDGFDHTQYKDEVEERWGVDAYAKSDEWWRSKTADEQQSWKRSANALSDAWIDASQKGIDPACEEAQSIAQRHFDWLRSIPGTPGGGTTGPTKEYFVNLAEMYVADDRFAAIYGGTAGATFVRDTMKTYADRVLDDHTPRGRTAPADDHD